LKFKNLDNISLIKKDHIAEELSSISKSHKNFKVSAINFVITIYDKVASFLNAIFFKKKSKYIIYHSYFPKKFLYRLSILLGQLPRLYLEFEQKVTYSENRRKDFVLRNFDSSNSFESFLILSIKKDIPIAYLESYKSILQIQSKFLDADVILTANAHFHCELFKSWAAEQTNQGAQLLISAHGGALYPKFSVFNHQEMISDTRIVWGKEWLPSQKRIAPNKLSFKAKKVSIDGDISIIFNNTPRYSIRCASIPMSALALDCYEQIKSFLELLDRDILLNVKAKLKNVQKGHYDFASRLIQDFNPSIISHRKSIYDVINHSRVVVCTYPQTTFSEAIFSGVPTMLIYEEKFYEVLDIYDELIDVLKEANIIHTTPESAAKHLKDIYQNPLPWWNEKATLDAREKFNSMCLTDSLHPLKDWHDLLLQNHKSAYNI
jgi:putative transferase (TIGR04331 family)